MKLTNNLGIATVALALSLAAAEVKPTQAAILNQNFTVDVTSGDNPGRYFGSFTYDNTNLSGVGEDILNVNNGLQSLVFNYLGTEYTQNSDFDFPTAGPSISFNNGAFTGLSFLVEDQFFIGDVNSPSTTGRRFYTILSADLLSTTEVGRIVPEPFTLFGAAIATATGFWVNRKKKVSA